MVYLAENATLRQARALALRSGFSRVPLIGENIDDVLGIVYLKDVIKAIEAGRPENDLARDVMRPATFVPESKPVDDLLSEMQAARTHMAIIVDEYGGTAGLVTIEDILEEIVGEITDEYDVERPPVEHLGDGSIRVTARLPVEDLGELFDVDLPGDEVETVGGLLAQALGRVPIPGAKATVDGLLLTAEGTTGRRNRIDTVLVRRRRDPTTTDAGATCERGNPPMSDATLTRQPPARTSVRRGREVGHPRAGRAGPRRRGRRRGGTGRRRPNLRRHHRSQLPSLSLTALQFAVASAVNGGTGTIEAAAVVTEASESLDAAGRSAVRDVSAHAPSPGVADRLVLAVR